jgi:hypothetical protein
MYRNFRDAIGEGERVEEEQFELSIEEMTEALRVQGIAAAVGVGRLIDSIELMLERRDLAGHGDAAWRVLRYLVEEMSEGEWTPASNNGDWGSA